jgi:hypothetical protein
MSSGPAPTPQAPAPAQKKSGLKVLLWVLGIFFAFVLICVIGFVVLAGMFVHKVKESAELGNKNPIYAAAKFAATLNPDVSIVSSDDTSGTLVLRDKRTGKTTTMKFDPQSKTMVVYDDRGNRTSMTFDPQAGRVVVTDDKGSQATITADSSAGTVAVQGPEGSMKVGAGADKSPSWVPMYPGATPQNNFSASDNDKQSGSYSFVSSDSADKVVGFYANSLSSAGMTISKASSNSGGRNTGVLTASDKDSVRTVIVSADEESDGTHVSVTFEEKKH